MRTKAVAFMVIAVGDRFDVEYDEVFYVCLTPDNGHPLAGVLHPVGEYRA